MTYQIGDSVIVTLPSGDHVGTIQEIIPGYGFQAEVKYRVQGRDFETVTSARTMRKNGMLFQ